MRISKPTIATTTTMTTTFGSLEILAAYHECGGNIALRGAQGQDPPSVRVLSAKQPPRAKANRNKEAPSESYCAFQIWPNRLKFSVSGCDQQHQQNEA